MAGYADELATMIVDVLESHYPKHVVYSSPQDGIRLPAFVVNVIGADYHNLVGNPNVADWAVTVTAYYSRVDIPARIEALSDLTDPGAGGVRARLEAGLTGQVGDPVVRRGGLEAPELTPDGAVAWRWDMSCFGPVG